MMSRMLALPLMSLALAAGTPALAQGSGPSQAPSGSAGGSAGGGGEARIWYFGRASVKIRTASGFVVYIDPYAPGDYSEPADLVLVTHGHGDHNQVGKTTLKAGASILAPAGAVKGKPYTTIAEGSDSRVGELRVLALPAANKNHPRGSGVGYLLEFEGLVLYHAGDTNYLPEMEGWKSYRIGWALLPSDGFYNMDAAEASRCAEAMGAARVLPIHSSPSGAFDAGNAKAVTGRSVLVLAPGESIRLEP